MEQVPRSHEANMVVWSTQIPVWLVHQVVGIGLSRMVRQLIVGKGHFTSGFIPARHLKNYRMYSQVKVTVVKGTKE